MDQETQMQKLLSSQEKVHQRQQGKSKYLRKTSIQKGCCSDSFEPRFEEMRQSYMYKGFCAKLQYFNIRRQYTSRNNPTLKEQLDQKLPINFNPVFQSKDKQKIRYTWIGHSTAVINIGNEVNILIDPVFSERCSPSQWIGPKRFRDPACKIKQLPKIDFVLISHDHYDHLDETSLSEIEDLFHPHYFVGLGSRDVMPKKSSKVHEMDWTETVTVTVNENQSYRIHFVPVCHWGRRNFIDLNRRLWGGFIVETPKKKKIFYSGDTGYCPVFKEIGQQHGPIDLAILPIGAYEPRELLKFQHFNPQDSVKCHKDIKSKKSVGVHWGTFPLGFEHWCQARDDLKEAGEKYQLKEGEFITVGHGQSLEIDH